MRFAPAILPLLLALPALAGTYTLAPAALDHGGLRGTSANYTLHGSAMPGQHGTSANYVDRTGFVGQLADAIATALDLTASPLTVNEGSTRQLGGTLIFDDLSTAPLPATDIGWRVLSGPVSAVSAGGLATAATVYQDTSAIVQGSYQSLTATLTLAVLDTSPDNFGAYAADGIADAWQVQYFGLNSPSAGPLIDADFDGQNNLFEYTAGVIPTSAASRFLIAIDRVPGQPQQKNLVFSPRLTDRTYVVKTSTTLQGPSWTTLTTTATNDAGLVRTVTDTSASGARKFYRVEITSQ